MSIFSCMFGRFYYSTLYCFCKDLFKKMSVNIFVRRFFDNYKLIVAVPVYRTALFFSSNSHSVLLMVMMKSDFTFFPADSLFHNPAVKL